MLCANARLDGRPVGVIANRRGFLKAQGRPRIGGIIYTESARKVAYFVETAERLGTPLIYLQDVSGFMVGPEAEREGIIRAGAEMVETMTCATVPKIVVTLNHASGAGYYAMAGQGFDPHFTFSWPTARIGVMEGESAVLALYSAELEKYKGGPLPEDLREQVERTRGDYERWLDARYAAARGHCDAVIDPLETRGVLSFALEASMQHATARSGMGAIMIRIANGQGFWGDWLEAPVRLVEQGPLDYLALDYLAEVTMSILQKQKQADPDLGYARDFPPLIGAHRAADPRARRHRDRQRRRRQSAGLRARSGAPRARPEGRRGARRRRVSAHRRVPRQGLRDARHGHRRAHRRASAIAYRAPTPTSARFRWREALATGANVVIAGRSTDTALALAPMVHRFGWAEDDFDKLAAGTIAGHIIECGAQCTGGNCQVDWQNIPDMANIGYPIVEAEPDGSFHASPSTPPPAGASRWIRSRSSCSTNSATRRTTSRRIASPISPASAWRTTAPTACASAAFAAARARPR